MATETWLDGHVLSHDGLLHEIIERMMSKPTIGRI